MGLIDSISSAARNMILGWVQGGGNPLATSRSISMVDRRDYRLGEQKRFLRKTREGFDDNVVGNFLGLALDRGISLLFGKPVEFDWEEGAPQETIDFIDSIGEANNKPILLHKLAMYGGEDGTVFVKLVPDEERGWRILAQDPIFKDVLCDPDDDEKVIRYVTQYKVVDVNGEEIAKRETYMAGNWEDLSLPVTGWLMRHEINSRATGGK